MKVKARDIIPGWPRGRSTSTFIENRGNLLWASLWGNFVFSESKKPIFPTETLEDLRQNVEYHEAQQRMNDEYFEIWRSDPTTFSDEYFPHYDRRFKLLSV